jgi:Caudovirus prohead serine protease
MSSLADRTIGRVLKQATIDEVDDNRTAEFIASSNREDRYGDIVEQTGWDLADFWLNPVFLWGHASYQPPIGWVREFGVIDEGNKTKAKVEFLPEGVDDFADKLFELTKIRAIRTVSVGFIPLEMEDITDDKGRWMGFRFLRNQLIELSLCSVPANPDAVQLARSLDTNPAFLRRVCDLPTPESLVTLSENPPSAREQVGKFTRRNLAMLNLAKIKGGASLILPGASGGQPGTRT